MRFKIKQSPYLIDQLREMLRLFSSKRRWTNGSISVDAKGDSVPALGPTACKFCIWGGAIAVAGDVNSYAYRPILTALDRYTRGGTAIDVNEGPDGYRRIVATIKRAIKGEMRQHDPAVLE